MTPPGNRYDRLNQVEGDAPAPLFGEEAWVQTPDGSWVRSTDKAAKKMKGKTKGKAAPAADPAPPPPPPAPRPSEAAKAEPKRRFGRKSAAEKEREAELDRQAEAELETLRTRRAEAERDRRAQAERDQQAELERERLAERELERQAELERERKLDLERKAAAERARAAELEREIEQERARVARLQEEVERERQRQSDLEYERERERDRQTKTDGKGWFDEKPVYPEPSRWPDVGSDYRSSDYGTSSYGTSEYGTSEYGTSEYGTSEYGSSEYGSSDYSGSETQYPEPSSWPGSEPAATRSMPKQARKPETRRRRTTHSQASTGRRIATGAMATAMAAAAVAVGAGITWLGPDPGSTRRPFAAVAEPGKPIDVRSFTITVQAARASTALQAGGVAQATQGAWVIVRVRLSANHEPTPVGYAAVRDAGGRTYLASDRVAQPLVGSGRTFQPGIPIEGDVIFEVPLDSLKGLTVLFAAHADQIALNAMAQVALPDLNAAPQQAAATLGPTEMKP